MSNYSIEPISRSFNSRQVPNRGSIVDMETRDAYLTLL
jgi:hypothetical protein